VAVEGPLVFDDEEMVLNAALAGLGLAFLIEDHVTPLVKSGALTRVLDDWCPPFPGFFLYYPGRRQASPALAAFIDAVYQSGGRDLRRRSRSNPNGNSMTVRSPSIDES